MAFTHLHVHTDYSPKDAIAQGPRVVEKVAADGQSAVAITDHGSLGGIWGLGRAAAAHGVKPIPGFEAYLALDQVRTGEDGEPVRDADGREVRTGRFDRAVEQVPRTTAATDAGDDISGGGMKEKKYRHLTVLARTRAGWSSLVRLHNHSWEAHWSTPRIDYELLHEHRDGLILLSGCLGGPVQTPLQTAVAAQAALRVLDERHDLTETTRERMADGQRRIIADGHAEAERAVQRMIDAVGSDNVFIEVMYHGIDGELEIIEALYAIADTFGLRCVATGDSHCVHEDDEPAQDAWLAIGNGRQLNDSDRWSFSGHGYWVKTEDEMRSVFPDDPRWQAACDTTQTVADMVADDVIPPPQIRLPQFPTPPGYEDSDAYFEDLVWEGAYTKWGHTLTQTHIDRLEHEITVITAKGYADYFLLTHDLISWCHSDYTAPDWVALQTGGRLDDDGRSRKQPIMTGPGRGSAAGAAVGYCLNLTTVDPIENGLLFERFLAPDKVSMPDIDTDFEQLRRTEVLEFLRIRWGRNHVAQIGTYGMSRSKAALQSSARTHGATHIGARLSSLVPMQGTTPRAFAEFLQEDSPYGSEFRAVLDDPRTERIVTLATQIEGVKANESVHASAVLISSEDLRDLVPMRKAGAADGQDIKPWVARWEGGELEDFGMLKLDVLGLENLDILHRTLDLLTEDGINVDLDSVDPNDLSDETVAATWRMLADGYTPGVFQMDGAGMTQLLTTAHPTRLQDLSTVIALYRPGPMGEGMHTLWASIKAGTAEKSYRQFTNDPTEEQVIASVLDETEGVIVLQEQLMFLAERIAGFGPFAKSRLQKAVSKKKMADLELLEPLFKRGGDYQKPDGSTEQIAGGATEFALPDGSMSPAFSADTLDILWSTFQASGNYLFNKAHSSAYGQLAFWTAYLKASWLRTYAAATLTIASKDENRAPMLAELGDRGIEVLPPDINVAEVDTRVIDTRIVYGISEVKGIADVTARRIVAERDARGPFTSLPDVADRLSATTEALGPGEKIGGVPAGQLAILVEAGGLDEFGARRPLAQVVRGIVKPTASGRTAPALPDHLSTVDWSPVERSARQKKAIQVSLGKHPTATAEVRGLLGAIGGGRLAPISAVPHFNGQSNAQIVGLVTEWVTRETKHGDPFVFGQMEDATGSVSFVAWPRALNTIQSWGRTPAVGDLVVASGQVSPRNRRDKDTGELVDDGDLQIVASDIRVVDVPRSMGPPSPAPVGFESVLRGADRMLLEGHAQPLEMTKAAPSADVDAHRLVRAVAAQPKTAESRVPAMAGATTSPALPEVGGSLELIDEHAETTESPELDAEAAPMSSPVPQHPEQHPHDERTLRPEDDGVVRLSDADVTGLVLATLLPGRSSIVSLVDGIDLPLTGDGVSTPMRSGRPRFEVLVEEDAWRHMEVRGVAVKAAHVRDAGGREGLVMTVATAENGAVTFGAHATLGHLSEFVLKLTTPGRNATR